MMVDKYALYSGALIKIAGHGHIEGAYVSAKDYHRLEAAASRLVAHAKDRQQEEWATLPDVLALQEALEAVEGR